MSEELVYIFIGIFIGGPIQFLFTLWINSNSRLEEIRLRTYLEFINIVSEEKYAETDGEFTKEFSELRSKIAIYGTKKVINKLADFYRKHEGQIKDETALQFAEVIQSMKIKTPFILNKKLANDISVLIVGKDNDGDYIPLL